MFTREELKKGLRNHMEVVEESTRDSGLLLKNPGYRTAACLLSIMEAQDKPVTVSTVGQRTVVKK